MHRVAHVHYSSMHMRIELHTCITTRYAGASSCTRALQLDAHVHRAAMRVCNPMHRCIELQCIVQLDAPMYRAGMHVHNVMHTQVIAHFVCNCTVRRVLMSVTVCHLQCSKHQANPRWWSALVALVEPWTFPHRSVLLLLPSGLLGRTPVYGG